MPISCWLAKALSEAHGLNLRLTLSYLIQKHWADQTDGVIIHNLDKYGLSAGELPPAETLTEVDVIQK